MTPNMLTHLAASNVRTSTYLRAWYVARAKEAMRGQCCGRTTVLALWFGVSKGTISDIVCGIVCGKTWKAVR